MARFLTENTDRMVGAIRKGKEIDKIQGYWEQIKEGLKTAGPTLTIASTLGPQIARLLGLIP